MTNATARLLNDTRFQDAVTRVGKLGQTAGKGENTRPELAREIVRGARDGYIGDDELGHIYDAFAAAAFKSEAKNAGKQYTQGDSFKVQVSKLRPFHKAALVSGVDFDEVLTRAMPIIYDDEAKGSVFDKMCKVARVQQDHPTALTDDEIRSALAPKQEDEKGELDYLKKIQGDLKKLIEGTKSTDDKPGRPAFPSADAESAMRHVTARIAELELEAEAVATLKKREALVAARNAVVAHQGIRLIPAMPR